MEIRRTSPPLLTCDCSEPARWSPLPRHAASFCPFFICQPDLARTRALCPRTIRSPTDGLDRAQASQAMLGSGTYLAAARIINSAPNADSRRGAAGGLLCCFPRECVHRECVRGSVAALEEGWMEQEHG